MRTIWFGGKRNSHSAVNERSASVHACVYHSILIVVVYSIISSSYPIDKFTSVTISNTIIDLVKYTHNIIYNNK